MGSAGGVRQIQREWNGRDVRLTRIARAFHPKVRHWWGRRTWTFDTYTRRHNAPGQRPASGAPQELRTGAWCYLCDGPIATWSSRWPVTETAREIIATHRDYHIRRLLDGRHSDHEERS